MTINQLNTFLKITESDSFSGAANSLGYAQSTVTTQIKQLEDELGCRLFDRLGKTVSLTSSGERLVAYAERMLQLERDIHLDLADDEEPTGTIKLGASESLCITRLPAILMDYQQMFPGMEIRLQFVTHDNISDLLQKGELDIVYTINPLIEDKSLKTVSKKKETLGFYASPDFMLQKKRINEGDLDGIPLLLTGHNCSFKHMLLADLAKYGITPRIALETSSKEILKQFAKNGLGVAFIPDITAEAEVRDGSLKRFDWRGSSFPIYSQVIVHKDKHLNRAISALIDMLGNSSKES